MKSDPQSVFYEKFSKKCYFWHYKKCHKFFNLISPKFGFIRMDPSILQKPQNLNFAKLFRGFYKNPPLLFANGPTDSYFGPENDANVSIF